MRKICVLTGTRADFGLLRCLLTELRENENIELQIVATGTHFSKSHGSTYKEIQDNGFEISEAVHMLLSSDTREAVAISLGLGVVGLATALSRLKPDVVVILGDRYEALAGAQSAMMLGIPIAHIHGGESTEGAIDEAIRHSISKMAHIHLVATESFRQRVLQLGEEPHRVFNVGAPGLDNIAALDITPKDALKGILGIPLKSPLFVVTFHPATLDIRTHEKVRFLLEAIQSFSKANVVFTGTNADALGMTISDEIIAFCQKNRDRMTHIDSLGVRNYLSLLNYADVVVGNSSSGLIEAPSIGVPTVNIGIRQNGRPRARSVVDCGDTAEEIAVGIETALASDFRNLAKERETPYGVPGAAKRMSKILIETDLEGILVKKFKDVSVGGTQ